MFIHLIIKPVAYTAKADISLASKQELNLVAIQKERKLKHNGKTRSK